MTAAGKHELSLRDSAGRFRIVALAEAFTWVGLLAGMYVKYLADSPTEIGVSIFGPLHGALFIAFVFAAVLAGVAFRWNAGTWILALLAAVVPFGTVTFVIWADRRGLLAPRVPVAGGDRHSDHWAVTGAVTDLRP